jgi:hypothetical protein
MNDTEKNLLAAFRDFAQDTPPPLIYRVYYDSATGNCLYTDVILHQDPHVEVDRATADNFNPVFYRVVDGKIKSREIVRTDKRILVQGNGKYKTLKGASMFLVLNDTAAPSVTWKVNNDN